MAHRIAESDGARKTYNHPCVIAQALDVLGDRWTLLILRDLMAGLHRYNDILESCAGMSPNVLSDRLKRLEAEGLVDRSYYKELPPRVEYTLTEKGWTVRPILSALVEPPRKSPRSEPYPMRVSERPVPRPRVNYLAIEAGNRSLGLAGEEFVVRFEVARLAQRHVKVTMIGEGADELFLGYPQFKLL